MISTQTKIDKYGDVNLLFAFAFNDKLDTVVNTFEALIQSRLTLMPYQFPFQGNPSDWEKSINESLSSCSSNSRETGKRSFDSSYFLKSGSMMKVKEDKCFFKMNKVLNSAEKDCKVRVNLRSECIRKRIKSKFHSFIINKLNDFVKGESKDIFFLSAPKKLRVSVNLRQNQKWMNMTLREAYTDSTAISNPSEKKSVEHNTTSFQKVKLPLFNEFINTTLKDLYLSFIESDEYKACIKELYTSRGNKYASRFLKVSEEFPQYYATNSLS